MPAAKPTAAAARTRRGIIARLLRLLGLHDADLAVLPRGPLPASLRQARADLGQETHLLDLSPRRLAVEHPMQLYRAERQGGEQRRGQGPPGPAGADQDRLLTGRHLGSSPPCLGRAAKLDNPRQRQVDPRRPQPCMLLATSGIDGSGLSAREGFSMDTVYDWMTIAVFGGLVVLFLHRSMQEGEPK